MENLETEKITIKTQNNGGEIVMSMSGEVDMEDPSVVLRPFLDNLHDTVINVGIPKVIADFKQVSFMNSSGIKEFVHWIMKLNSTPADKKYTVKVVYSSGITWQATSLPVLQKLQPDLISVEAG